MRKFYKALGVGIPIAVLSTSGIVYVAIAAQKENMHIDTQLPTNDGTITIDRNELHATLYTKDLYDDIKIKNGNAIIDDDMIGKILSKLINEAHFINYDGVMYNYKILNANEVMFTISWPEDGATYTKNYLVNITRDM